DSLEPDPGRCLSGEAFARPRGVQNVVVRRLKLCLVALKYTAGKNHRVWTRRRRRSVAGKILSINQLDLLACFQSIIDVALGRSVFAPQTKRQRLLSACVSSRQADLQRAGLEDIDDTVNGQGLILKPAADPDGIAVWNLDLERWDN